MKIRQFAWNLALAGTLDSGEARRPSRAGGKRNLDRRLGLCPYPSAAWRSPRSDCCNPGSDSLGRCSGHAGAPPAPTPPLLDNPGNVPVVIPDSDPSNVTIRQLVRVAVAGKRIRLRLSNEDGSEALTLGRGACGRRRSRRQRDRRQRSGRDF